MLFQNSPAMFGSFHIIWLIGIAAANIALVFCAKKLPDETLIKAIHILGAVMLIGEVWKQWYSYTYVFEGRVSLWFFPWQLCSMAMYLSFALPYLKPKGRETALVFLSTFSLFAAVIALVIPSDMLRPQILFSCHGFLYHGIMVAESLLSIIILKRREDNKFLPSVILFLAMAAIAEIINVIGYGILKDIKISPNMFYITPYYATTQVGLNYIAKKLGIFPEIIIYLSGIVLMSYLIHFALFKYRSKDRLA